MKNLIFILTFLTMILVPAAASPIQVQEQNSGSNSSSSDPEDIPEIHHEVTVVATRNPTSIREVGRSVTVITSEDIAAQGARTVSQVLEIVPGMSVVQAGSFGAQTSLFVRGGESNFNLVMIDGIPANRVGGEFDFSSLTTANIERIEIVRGPSSVLYGADAAGATINIITRKGDGRPTGNLAFEAGNYATKRFLGNLAGSGSKAAYSFGFMTSETDGIYDFNSQDRRTELSARSGFSISKSSNLEASLRYSTGKNQFPTDSTGAPVDPNDFRRGSDQVYSVLFGQQINAAFSTQVQYGYNRHDSNTFTIADGIDDFFDSKLRQAESRHYIDWQNNLIAGNNHQLTGGLSFRRESSLTDAYQRRSVGFYIQDQVNLNSRAFLTAGIRYDDNNRFSNFTTGSIDFSFLLIDSLKYRASFGNGFRAPDFAEIEGFPLWGIVGNPNLKPEKNTAFDTGVDFVSPSGSSSLSGTFFYSRFSDLIEFTFLAPPGSPNYLNIEEAESSGFEIEGSHRLNQMLRFGMNYTFTRTEVLDSGNVPGGGFEKGQSLLRRPRHLANLFTVLTQKGYSFRFDLRYKGAREDLQFFPDFSSRRITLPGFWKFDFGATIPLFGFQNEKGTLAAIFRGENLFNSDYQEIAGFQTPGRVLQGGLEVLF